MSPSVWRVVKAGVLMIALAACGASSGRAATGPAMFNGPGPTPPGANTGAVSENGATYGPYTFTAGNVNFSCVDMTFRVTSVTSTTAAGTPTWSGCTYIVSGSSIGAGTVTLSCGWTLEFANATFIDSAGAVVNGTMATTCTRSLSVPSIGCTIDVLPQTSEGVSLQNIDSAGANSVLARPWGTKTLVSASGLTYTATGSCAGLSEHGSNATDSVTLAIKDLWGML